MQSLDVANLLITRYGNEIELTNLKPNKLVYFAQAISLRKYGTPLFDDEIQAWDYGPVEPKVYYAFNQFGSGVIRRPQGDVTIPSDLATNVIRDVMESFGKLTAFDLVRLSHRDGSAWKSVYVRKANKPITPEVIIKSRDGEVKDIMEETLALGVAQVNRKWPNAMRMLENS